MEKIAVAVRHYFGQYEEGEERPVPVPAEPVLVVGEEAIAAAAASDEAGDEVHSMTDTPEEILAGQAADGGSAEEVNEFSTEDIAEAEDEILGYRRE